MVAQVVLTEKKSTYGSPYGYYTVTLTPSSRTATSVTVKCTVSAHLAASNSFTGYGVTCGLYIGGSWHDFTLVASGTTWQGTTPISKSTTFTVSGLTESQTSITGIKFRAIDGQGASTGPSLSATSCSNLAIDYYTAPVQPDAPALADTSGIAVPYIYINGSWVVAITNL